MRIVVDLQACQSDGSRVRGIGRYSLALIQAMLEIGRDHHFILLANAALHDVRPLFENLCLDPDRSIDFCQWYAPGPLAARWTGNQARRRIAEQLRLYTIERLQPDIVYIPSFFEGYGDDCVLTIPQQPSCAPTAVTHYDLIPLLQAETYLLPQPGYAAFYRAKLEQLKQASLLLSISEYAAEEAIEHLQIQRQTVVNVSSACDPALFCASAVELPEDAHPALGQAFILYSGAGDPRKNLRRLVEAYGLLPLALQQQHPLVLVGKLCDAEIQDLRRWTTDHSIHPDRVVLLGYVDDATLSRLYARCKVFVLPSLHEGFGLPALEAMSCGAAVVGSNCTSIPEVIGDPQALFDPLDCDAIAAMLLRVLTDKSFHEHLLANARVRSRLFSWTASARRALEAMHQLHVSASPGRRSVPWPTVAQARALCYRQFIQDLQPLLSAARRGQASQFVASLADAIAFCEWQSNIFARIDGLDPMRLSWRVEGPYDSTYSLAVLNRHLALALAQRGHQVSLFATEGPGDYTPDPQFLQGHPEIAALAQAGVALSADTAEVTSRNLYPPRVSDLNSRLNGLHAYGWEESGFPQPWVEDFNRHLQTITVMSEHVKRLLINNGVSVPIVVCGLGTDHLSQVVPQEFPLPRLNRYRFLHVSSCFPRKGLDELLEAFAQAFTAADDVTLIIKTFANPHHNIDRILADWRDQHPQHPDVVLLLDDLKDAEMAYLFSLSDAFVAPSKAEGFGLPFAEAMQFGLPVITTAWGGQRDFCTPATAWLVDYSFAWAKTHFGLYPSVWAQPDVAHLSGLLRTVWSAPPDAINAKTEAARSLLRERYAWSHVAARLEASIQRRVASPSQALPRIGWISPWNVRCGIASYSHQLLSAIDPCTHVFADHVAATCGPDSNNVHRCWTPNSTDLHDLEAALLESACNCVVFQFNFGFFDCSAFSTLLQALHQRGVTIVLMMHATLEPPDQPDKRLHLLLDGLRCCDRILVHTPADLNRLKRLGLIDQVALFPHGLPPTPRPRRRLQRCLTTGVRPPWGRCHRLATYGFFLPHKGLLEAIAAVHQLRQRGLRVTLDMVNAEYPNPSSAALIDEAKALIQRLGLCRCVRLHTAYQSDSSSLKMLAKADLIVYPYQHTLESSSAAVRHGLAAGPPVCVTPLPIFDDVASVVHTLPGTDVHSLTSGLATLLTTLSQRPVVEGTVQARLEAWRSQHQFADLGPRLYGLLCGLLNG